MRAKYHASLPAFLVASCISLAGTGAAAEGSRLSGFYLGGFGGVVVLDSTVVFPATTTRPEAKFVDQGGDGVVLGVRGGWGTMVGRNTYAGVEAEFVAPMNVTSRLMALGTEYRARLRNEVGVYGRVGWAPAGQNSMMFLRAGVSVPRQTFQAVQGGNTAKGADWSLVPTVGIGAETHLSRNLVARIDATYSWPQGTNVIESYRMTAGLAWRF